jgi:hypothetical protein
MSGDLLFPIPEPTFIFVHQIYVIPKALMVSTLSERGQAIVRLPPREDYPEPTVGYLTAPNERRDMTNAIERQTIDAVCLMPLNTQIDYPDYLFSDDPQLPPHLAGAYFVDTVRANISHLRVLLRRYRHQWEIDSPNTISLLTGVASAAGNEGALEAVQ